MTPAGSSQVQAETPVLLVKALPRTPLGLLCVALDAEMKRTMCGQGGGERALHHPSRSPSAKELSQNSLESVAVSYEQGRTESDRDVYNGFQMSGHSCLPDSER